MARVVQGQLLGSGRRFGVVVSRFNSLISEKLLEGAIDCLQRHGVSEDDITVAWVPGAFEIPTAAHLLAESGQYDGVLCLGTLIRGATPHFDHISSAVTKKIADLAVSSGVPVLYGVLTTDTLEQALERAGSKAGNKGAEAAAAALEMASLVEELQGEGKQ
ncbi:MAG: 6,7-dimethyl-8-ribityllumazine synthase [Planctomycetota bacterium]